MFSIFKKIFRVKKSESKTVEELKQQKRDLEVQLELLIELEKKIKEKQKSAN